MSYLLSSSPHIIPANKFQVNQFHVSLLMCKDYLPGILSVEHKRENPVHLLEDKDVSKKKVFYTAFRVQLVQIVRLNLLTFYAKMFKTLVATRELILLQKH